MMPSRGMGNIAPGKVPRAKRRGDSKPVIGTGKPIKTFKGGGLYENIHKKFIQENKKIKKENTNCIICDFNSPIICNLRCCQQEICLNCISRMFLSNLVSLNAEFLLFVPCPFCRRSMSWESYSLKCENEERF